MDEENELIPWENPLDLLDRKKYADFLTDYLSSRDGSFVLNLNASWGMGKTFFLTHWRASLDEYHPTVYINAWETDFSDDPMISVISALHEQLSPYLPEEENTKESFARTLKAGGRFIKGIAPIVAKGLINKAIGTDAANEAQNMFTLTNEDIGELTEKSMSALLEDHISKEKSVKEFQIALSGVADKILQRDGASPPIFVFIDELDRCRPTYAIELLEAVKHLFSVTGIVFIIATDSAQLQHSVCAIYGANFDGGEYIRRFFDQEYALPLPSYNSYCNALAAEINGKEKLDYLKFQPWSLNGIHRQMPHGWDDMESLSVFLALFSKHYHLPLRTVNQMGTRLEAILESTNETLDGPFLLLLLALNSKYNGFVGHLRELCEKGELKAASRDLVLSKLISGGESIRWYFVSQWEPNNHSDSYHKVADIGITYLQSIQKFLHANEHERGSFISDNTGLEDYLLTKMAYSRSNPDNVDNIIKYFGYVEIASALS